MGIFFLHFLNSLCWLNFLRSSQELLSFQKLEDFGKSIFFPLLFKMKIRKDSSLFLIVLFFIGMMVPGPLPPPPPPPRTIYARGRDFAAIAIIISGVTYGLYKLFQVLNNFQKFSYLRCWLCPRQWDLLRAHEPRKYM